MIYFKEIDGLRGIAIILVLLFHFFPDQVSGGFIGVDVFFVISGYIITSIIIKELKNKEFTFADFYTRRIRRLFPALISVYTALLFLGCVLLTTKEYSALGRHIFFGGIFGSNFLLASEIGYFDDTALLKPLLHLWSLAIEVQFYLFWPLVIFILYKIQKKFLFLLFVIVLSSFIFNVYEINYTKAQSFYIPTVRFWELGLGGILASIEIFNFSLSKVGRNVLNENSYNFLAIIGFLLILFPSFFYKKSGLYPGVYALAPTLGAVLIIITASKSYFCQYFLSGRLIVFFGKISYPLYLWHWPLYSLSTIVITEDIKLIFKVSLILLAVFISWITFKFIETPLKTVKNHGREALILFMFLFLISSLGFYIHINKGEVFGKKNDVVSEYYETTTIYGSPINVDADCAKFFSKFANYDRCLISKKEPMLEIVVIGDSHSAVLFKEISDFHKEKNVMNIGVQACLPFTGRFGVCDKIIEDTYDFIIKEKSVSTVYLVGYWHLLYLGSFSKERPGGGDFIGWNVVMANKFKEEGNKILKKLSQAGKRVVFIRDVPDIVFSPSSCIKHRPFQFLWHLRSPCAMLRSEFELRERRMDELINDILANNSDVLVLDPRTYLCDDYYCYAEINGVMLYHDRHHLRQIGAKMLMEHFSKYSLVQ